MREVVVYGGCLVNRTSSRAYRILVVDDCPDITEAVSILVEALGHVSCVANSGRDALEQASRFAPEIVILDLGLPDLSGIEVVRTIRSSPRSRAVHVVALTGYGRQRDRDDAIAAGVDQFVIKPGDVRALVGTAVHQLSRASSPVHEMQPSRACASRIT